MSTFQNYTTATGREIKVRPNHQKRHFTIKTDSAIFRTLRMTKRDFENCLENTGNDWNDFLKSGGYYTV